MSPKPPQSFPKDTTNTFKSYKSPPPKKQPVDEDTPPVPPPPPPPLVIPGPNAFAQQKRVASDERRAFEANGRFGDSGSPTQAYAYTVKNYRDIDASHMSPTIRRNQMRASRNHHRANSSTDKSQSVLSTSSSAAVASTTWEDLANSFESPAAFLRQHPVATSKFYQTMRLAQDRLDEDDEDNEKRQQHSQPSSAASERLKLVPSPDPNKPVIPTYQAAREVRDAERFKDLLQNNGTVPSGVQIANIHEDTPEPQKGNKSDTPVNKSSGKTDKSPKKGGFFNKLGLGLKMAGQDENQSTVLRHPSMRNVPHKAAKVLGAQSLPSRDRHPASTRARAWDDISPASNSPLVDSSNETMNASAPKKSSSPSKMPTFSPPVAEDHSTSARDENTASTSPLRRESRRIPIRTQLRHYDDDNPPTPPSKPRPGRIANDDAQEEASTEAGESEKGKSGTSRTTEMQSSLLPTDAHRAGYAGHHASAQIGTSPAISSMYGSLGNSPDASPITQHLRGHFPHRVSQMVRATRNGALPPTRYDPTSPQATWSFSHLPLSMESLRPGPLQLPEHKRSQSSNALQPQKSLSGNASQKPRNASESTSMSVPVFIDGQDQSMSAAGTSEDTARGDATSREQSETGSSNAVVSTQLVYEYLVETFNQNETITASVQAQKESVEALETSWKSHLGKLTTQLVNVEAARTLHHDAVHDEFTSVHNEFTSVHNEFTSVHKGLTSVHNDLSDLTRSGQQHEAATAANTTTLSEIQAQISALTSATQDIQRHLQSHFPLQPTQHDTSTFTTPTSPLTPTTSDFAPRITHPSQTFQTYPPYTNASPARAGTSSPQHRSPDKTSARAQRNLQVQAQSQAQAHGQAQGQPQPIQRMDTTPLFGSSPMRSPRSRADMQSHATSQHQSQSQTHSQTQLQQTQARAGTGERESPAPGTSTNTSTNTSTSTETMIASRGDRTSGPRGYLQSVPQSAMTDPGVRGQTWGRKAAIEKASRWTG